MRIFDSQPSTCGETQIAHKYDSELCFHTKHFHWSKIDMNECFADVRCFFVQFRNVNPIFYTHLHVKSTDGT